MTVPTTVPELRTERLLLRQLRASDREAVVRVFADPAASRWLSADLSDPAAANGMVDRRLGWDGPAGMGHWVFEFDGVVVGLGHLRPSWELPGELPEVGWYIAPEHGGRGLATEGAAALLAHGLTGLGLPAVWALINERNEPSLRLARRLGFLDVGAGPYYGGPHRVHVALADRSPGRGNVAG